MCSKHVCEDGVDDDGDGKNDYPNDPGCDDAGRRRRDRRLPERAHGPLGPNCPECGNGSDDDDDGKTDFPADPNCMAASSTSEWCLRHESVQKLVTATTMGDTTGLPSDYENPSCTFATAVPDLT